MLQTFTEAVKLFFLRSRCVSERMRKHVDVIRRLEMSLSRPEGLAGERAARDSLQTLTFSDAAAAETRSECANPNCECFTAEIWTEGRYTCSPLHLLSSLFLRETDQQL